MVPVVIVVTDATKNDENGENDESPYNFIINYTLKKE